MKTAIQLRSGNAVPLHSPTANPLVIPLKVHCFVVRGVIIPATE